MPSIEKSKRSQDGQTFFCWVWRRHVEGHSTSSLLSSCGQMGWDVFPSSAPSMTRTTLPEESSGHSFWSRVKHLSDQCSSEVIGLKCSRELTQSELTLQVVCLWGAMEALPIWPPELRIHLLHEALSLLDSSCILYMSNLHMLIHFLWSGLKSYKPSAFPIVSSLAKHSRARWSSLVQDAPLNFEIPVLDRRMILPLIASSGLIQRQAYWSHVGLWLVG